MIDECGSEAIRLYSLKSYDVLDTPREAEFDDIVAEAVMFLDAPIALISLVDEHRQWFKARIGLAASEMPRAGSFCDHTVRTADVMVVADATKDVRFAGNPFVTADPNIRFYAGAPLKAPNGARIGTLCVIDDHPRPGITADQSRRLEELADRTMTALRSRRMRSSLAARAA